MLDALAAAGHTLPPELESGFYGPDSELEPEYCRQLAEWMEDHAEAYAATCDPESLRDEVEAYRYAAWWLRWVADRGDGAIAWW